MTDQTGNILLYFKCVSVNNVDTKIFLRNDDTRVYSKLGK